MAYSSNQDREMKPRVLLFSNRNIYEQEVWRCSWHDFERILQEIDSVDVVAPKATRWYPYGKRVALRVGERFRLPFNPGIETTTVERDYDLFVAICEKPSELLHLESIKGWRDRCKKTVCFLPEYYVNEIPSTASAIEVLSRFDHVIFMFNTNEPFKKVIKGHGEYQPAGIDTLLFCPYPNPPARCIDVLSIGRRAKPVHEGLMRMAKEDNKFYVYDTINDLHAYNLDEHRLMMANRAKRSRYFIVSPGKFNAPAETGGQIEFGYRYFEAAAPGTIMIGMRCANNKEFDKIFNWKDAVIEVPFDSDAIVDTIRELDKQPERQMRISQTNIRQCLLNHDWVYRWEALLNTVGMQPLPMLLDRKERLRKLAELTNEAPLELEHSRT